MQEFATLMTETVITTLNIDGSTLMPASLMAITYGEYFELAPTELRRLGLVYGTISPKIKSEMT